MALEGGSDAGTSAGRAGGVSTRRRPETSATKRRATSRMWSGSSAWRSVMSAPMRVPLESAKQVSVKRCASPSGVRMRSRVPSMQRPAGLPRGKTLAIRPSRCTTNDSIWPAQRPAMTASGPLLAEPLAAVLGGIVALSASAIALVAWRDELRQGPVMRPAVWAGAGAAGGALLYAAGLVVLGRGAELAQPAALLGGVPWALALVMLVGAGVAWVSGARAGWHPAGVCVLAALVLACTGWAAFLVTARVGAFLAR